MKKIFLFALVVALFSCKDDDDDNKPEKCIYTDTGAFDDVKDEFVGNWVAYDYYAFLNGSQFMAPEIICAEVEPYLKNEFVTSMSLTLTDNLLKSTYELSCDETAHNAVLVLDEFEEIFRLDENAYKTNLFDDECEYVETIHVKILDGKTILFVQRKVRDEFGFEVAVISFMTKAK